MKNSILSSKNKEQRTILLLLLLICSNMANAQSIKQIGPGAGGQERAVYIYPNLNNSYDLYVGSDVSGVWRATNIPANGFGNVYNYTYNFISNHEIMRFVNKFYRADMLATPYLFCLNRSGIDRIDLNNYSSSMSTVPVFESSIQITMEDSWVSDMYVNASSQQTYFITGNTRVTDDGPGNFKGTNVSDIFTGTLTPTYNRVDIIGQKKLYDLSTTKRDVYCLHVDDQSNTDATDDIIFVGAENGLHIITHNELAGTASLLPTTQKAGPSTNQLENKVTSLFLVSKTTQVNNTIYSFVATVHGMGLYRLDCVRNTSNLFFTTITWTLLSTNVKGINQGTPQGCNQSELYLIPKFTKCLPVYSGAAIAGYYITNEINLEKLCTGSQANYFTGVYYCPADANGFPDAGGLEPLTVWQPSLNDWGWNATKPAANINGALITPVNTLLIGKQGNIFVTSNDGVTPNENVHWHQVYDLQSTVANCNTENQYIHRGYINTANKTIYPSTKTDVWIGQADRLIFRDNNSNDYYHSIDATNTCYTFNYTGQSCGNNLGKNDCWFITNNTIDGEDQNIYIGIGEGYASQVGCGHVMFGDKDGNTFNEIGSTSINGDPRKILFTTDGNKFLLVNKTINPNNHKLRLFTLVNIIWTEIDLSTVNNYAVSDAVISPDGKNIFAIIKEANDVHFYAFPFINGILGTPCSTSVGTSDVAPVRLSMLRYGAHLENYKILCGTVPIIDGTTTDNFFEVYNSALPNTCVSYSINPSNGLSLIFKSLHKDVLDNTDEGITATAVNEKMNTLFVATVTGNTYNFVAPVSTKSHLYKASYNFLTGVIDNNSWIDITTTLPNKTIIDIATHGSTTCDEYLYLCLRGLGGWQLALPSTATINPNAFNSITPITGYGLLTSSVTIGANVTIDGANIGISPGKTITVPFGKTLKIINGSHLYACGDMWQGIVVDAGGTLIVDGSIIEDAVLAIINNGLKLTVINSTFEHNYVSISLNDQNFSTTEIYGNKFSCTSGQISKVPYNGQQTRYHISVGGVDGLTIGNSALNKNIFQNASKAIFVNNSNVDIINNQFEWIPNNLNTWGEAIYIDGKPTISTVRKIGGSANANDKNTFINWKHNIIVKNAGKILIENNVINPLAANRSFVGISQQKCTDVTIKGNAINRSNNGIKLFDNPGPTVTVTLNTFNKNFAYDFTKYDDEAIRFENNLDMKTKIYTITNNEIYNVAVGLHGLNTNATLDFNTYNTQINLNDLTTYFTTHNSQPQFGIWMQNATGSALRNNAVVWSGNSFITVDELSKLHGIRMQGSGSCVLQENTMTRFGGGIDIFDDCSKTQLECNTMDGCYHGVYFDINGPNNKLTDQGVAVFDPLYNAALSKTWHNHWINNVGTNKVDGQYFNAQFSWMYFDNPFDADYAPIPKPNYVIARPCSLNTSICAEPIVNDDHLRMAAYGAAVGDSSYAEYDSTEYAHSDKSTFYKAAKADSTVLYLGLPSDAKYIAEFDSLKLTNIGLFEDAKDAINNNTNSLALQKLSAMINQNIIDENNKYMAMLVAINYDASLDADSDTIVVVNNIAMMHPFYGGEAVYIARAMLHLNIIDVLPPLRRQHKANISNETLCVLFQLMPNPAKEEIAIISNIQFGNTKLEIFDSFGALVYIKSLPLKENKATINVSNLCGGIYHAKIIDAHTSINLGKLVIIK